MPELYGDNTLGWLYLILLFSLVVAAIRQGRKIAKDIKRRDAETRNAMGIDDGNNS